MNASKTLKYFLKYKKYVLKVFKDFSTGTKLSKCGKASKMHILPNWFFKRYDLFTVISLYTAPLLKYLIII